ncbi:MAG: hypothetical protein H7Y86_04315 [Rhizobacter sp.]|nr:hypothetical protein [Ferruginibacter sp.]
MKKRCLFENLAYEIIIVNLLPLDADRRQLRPCAGGGDGLRALEDMKRQKTKIGKEQW